MARKKKTKPSDILKEFRCILDEADRIIEGWSGKGLKVRAAGILKSFSNDVYHRATGQEVTSAVDQWLAACRVLGVSPDADQDTVKKVYVRLVKLYHEAGEAPNPEKAKEVNAAYQKICEEKGWRK